MGPGFSPCRPDIVRRSTPQTAESKSIFSRLNRNLCRLIGPIWEVSGLTPISGRPLKAGVRVPKCRPLMALRPLRIKDESLAKRLQI